MRRKISAILVTVLIMLMVMPMGAFAAVPSVQEVETLIAQIGTVTRENRSAVEKAVNAYNQLDDASKAGVSNFDVLAEAQQILGIKDALAKLNIDHDKVENSIVMVSPYTVNNESVGQSVMAPAIIFVEQYDQPLLAMAVEYIGEEHLWMNVVKVRAGENKYEYYYGDFPLTDAGEEKIKNKTVAVETGTRIATDNDYNMFMNILNAKEAIVRFSNVNYGRVMKSYDYTITNEDLQAITDVLNAYNLMCSVSPDVLRKALA